MSRNQAARQARVKIPGRGHELSELRRRTRRYVSKRHANRSTARRHAFAAELRERPSCH